MRYEDIRRGHYYTDNQTVREVLSVFRTAGKVFWKAPHKDHTRECKLKNFATWAKRQVTPIWVNLPNCPTCGGKFNQEAVLSCVSCGEHFEVEVTR